MGLYNANIIGGKSAYMSAVEGGYKGTEAEFNSTLGNLGMTFSSTLLSGETTLVFEDERLTTESVLDSVYTSVFGVKIKSATFGEGTLTLEFPSQEADMEVKVVVDADVSDNLSGASGEKGADGKDGKDGVDGKSAYQYAVDGGYEGTEEEFASLMASGGSGDIEEIKNTLGYTASKNLLENTATTTTSSGITYTVNEDGSVTLNGTTPTTSESQIFINRNFYLSKGKYILSGCTGDGATNKYYVQLYKSAGTSVNAVDIGQGATFVIADDNPINYIRILIGQGQVFDNVTFYPMIRKADITDDTYEPYGKSDVDSRLSDLKSALEWKLQGETTSSTSIKLPNDYKEIKLISIDKNNRNVITFTISKQEIDVLNSLDSTNGHKLHTAPNSNYTYYKSTGIFFQNYNGNAVNSSTIITSMYYR